MRALLKKTGFFIARGFLSLIAIFCLFLIALQAVLVVGINTVSTGRGSDFLAQKVNEAMQESGYTVAFDRLSYDPVQGISLRNFALSDKAGPFLQVDRFSLNISFILSPLRTLTISAHGDTLHLSRLPAGEEAAKERKEAALAPFAKPDIYFQRLFLKDFSFERVILEEPVAGKNYEFSPAAKADLSLKDGIGVSLTIKPGSHDSFEGVEAPEEIAFAGTLIPETLKFHVDSLSINAPSYYVRGDGTGDLSAEGSVRISATAAHKNLMPLTGGAVQEASAEILAQGPLSALGIDAMAKIVSGNLKERGLSDILLQIKTPNIQDALNGTAHIETTFQNDPIALDANISYTAPDLRIANIKGSAPDINLTGDILFSTETSLIDGNITLSAKDISRYKELAGIDIAGKADAKVVLKSSSSEEQAADIELSAAALKADSIKVKELTARASIASLTHPWPHSADIQSAGLQVSEDVILDTLNAAIAETGAKNYRLTVKGAGRIPDPVTFDGKADIADLAQTIPSFKDIIFTTRMGGSSAKISGNLSSVAVDLSLTAQNYQGKDIPAALPPQLDKLRINLDATLTGSPEKPRTDMTADLRGLGEGIYENAVVRIKAIHDGERIQANITGSGKGIRKLDVQAAAPMSWGLLPFHFTLDQSAPLQGTLAANLDLAAITPAFMPPTQSLSGTIIADGTLSGSISAPEPRASVRLSEAKFEDSENGIVIDKLFATANITQRSLVLESLSATDGKDGTIKGSGTLAFDGSAANIGLQARNFNAPRSSLANGIMNADISLKGNAGKMDLAGKADILEMNILIPETFSSNIPQLNIVEDRKEEGHSLLENLTLNVMVEADNQIFVRGWGLDAEFGGKIDVTGTGSTPQFNGTFASRRGRFEEFGKRFKLERANLRFQGSMPPSPYLDIEATTPAGDVTGSILMSGSVQSPSIKFASVPALPEDEVLSRILFGKDSAKISPFQAVQLARTIRRFSGEGGGGFDPLDTLRSATGLDDISVDTDESGATNIGAGKYLTDKVYLELSKGKAENSGEATIQIELTPSISIESEIGQDAQGGGGLFWKHDY